MKRADSKVKEVEKQWLTVAEAEKYLGFGTRPTQQEWRDSGELPYHVIGRVILYDKADLDDFVRRHRVNPINHIKTPRHEQQAQ